MSLEYSFLFLSAKQIAQTFSFSILHTLNQFILLVQSQELGESTLLCAKSHISYIIYLSLFNLKSSFQAGIFVVAILHMRKTRAKGAVGLTQEASTVGATTQTYLNLIPEALGYIFCLACLGTSRYRTKQHMTKKITNESTVCSLLQDK